VTEKFIGTTGIDPGTVRLVAQHLNHYATQAFIIIIIIIIIYGGSRLFRIVDTYPPK
jgi:hypothetical protein